MRFPILLASILIAAPALSQDSEARMLQRIVNNAGERCDAVVNLRPGAQVDNGDVLVIVDCSDGSSHVVRLKPDDSVSYYMSCSAWANPIDC